MILDRLTFGRAIPSGGAVTDDDWQRFERDHVAPRFPLGFTVTQAIGAWQDVDSGRTIHEPSIILEVAHNGGAEDGYILAVAGAYKSRFGQDAVMRSTVQAAVSFL